MSWYYGGAPSPKYTIPCPPRQRQEAVDNIENMLILEKQWQDHEKRINDLEEQVRIQEAHFNTTLAEEMQAVFENTPSFELIVLNWMMSIFAIAVAVFSLFH